MSLQKDVQEWFHSKEVGAGTYDDNWHTLPYFVSSRETAVEMSMLRQLDAEILIGQLSYKQRAEIYNYTHGYEIGATGASSASHEDTRPQPSR